MGQSIKKKVKEKVQKIDKLDEEIDEKIDEVKNENDLEEIEKLANQLDKNYDEIEELEDKLDKKYDEVEILEFNKIIKSMKSIFESGKIKIYKVYLYKEIKDTNKNVTNLHFMTMIELNSNEFLNLKDIKSEYGTGNFKIYFKYMNKKVDTNKYFNFEIKE